MMLSLPAELLLEISAHLHGDEVSQICLASTCRDMYTTIIPEVRKEHAEHVQDFLIPVGFLGVYKSNMAVVPRHKGVYGVELSVLHAEATLNGEAGQAFQGNIGTANIWLMPKEPKDIRAVRSLLMSAPELKHIHLQIPSSCQLKVLVKTLSMCAARPSTRLTITDSLQHWSREITPILGRTTSSMLDKSPSGDMSWSSKLRLSEALRRIRRDSQPQETPCITALSIENDVLFFFEIYPLLIRLINTAPLKALHLGRPSAHELRTNVQPLRESHWATILSAISTRATLVSFTLVPLAPEDLFAFLARHPHITHLALDITTLTSGVSFNKTPRLLPNLTTLEGIAPTVLPFLAARKDMQFSALQHLILKTDFVYFEDDMKNHPLHPVYDHITRHNSAYASIQVPSLCSSGLLPWIFSSTTESSALPNYHNTPQRRLINVKKVIFERSDPCILPSLYEAAKAWSREQANLEDHGIVMSTSAVESIVVNVLRRAFSEIGFELLHLSEVPAPVVEIVGSSLTHGPS